MDVSDDASTTAGLGNRTLLDKIDKLRELGIQKLVPLPQMVVVGDQSAGKSSVLESLTGFHFPRSVSLCTRHATEIICRRENTKSIVISIQPADGADAGKAEEARKFSRELSNLDAPGFEKIFSDAAQLMGIKSGPKGTGSAFSRDVLRVEISGPDEQHLTVIDVPGMFENPTPGVTTDDDIVLVKDMVKRYIRQSRTIILAVVPCNVDIANQKILTYAKEVDPDGQRTLGVLTKPDLASEEATKEAVADLVLGRRGDLNLGYCLVRNRGADDKTSSNEERDRVERAFFADAPWNKLPEQQLGVAALKIRIQKVQMERTRSEFPKVRADIKAKLKKNEREVEDMGQPRGTTEQQRMYLGEIVSEFNRIKDQGLDAYYNRSKIFDENPGLKLITRIREVNELFAKVIYDRGHTREFKDSGDAEAPRETKKKVKKGSSLSDFAEDQPAFADDQRDQLYGSQLSFQIPLVGEEELDDILSEPYCCPSPLKDGILEHIETEYMTSRGIELGTFSGEMLPTTFKEQSRKWAPMARSHVSNTILIVHHFIRAVLDQCCPDRTVRTELWSFILEDLRARYRRAVDHAEFLLAVEFEGTSMTYCPSFRGGRDSTARQRKEKANEEINKLFQGMYPDDSPSQFSIQGIIERAIGSGDEVTMTRRDIHDVLFSYYGIARDRFVDVLCLQVVHHHLLQALDSPLNVLSSKALLNMSADELDAIAGEEIMSRERRRKLMDEIDNLSAALKILRA